MSSSSINSLVFRPLSSNIYLKLLSLSFCCSSRGSIFSNSAKSKSSLIIYWSLSWNWLDYLSSRSNSSIKSFVLSPLSSSIYLKTLSFSFCYNSRGSIFSSYARSKSSLTIYESPYWLIYFSSLSSSSINSLVLRPLSSSICLNALSFSFYYNSIGSMFSNSAKSKSSLTFYWSFYSLC